MTVRKVFVTSVCVSDELDETYDTALLALPDGRHIRMTTQDAQSLAQRLLQAQAIPFRIFPKEKS